MCFFREQVKGDSLVVIQALTSQARCNTLYGHVVEDTRRLGATLQSCQFQHVRRKGNKLAHALAGRVVSFVDTNVWVEYLLSDLNVIFQSDLH